MPRTRKNIRGGASSSNIKKQIVEKIMNSEKSSKYLKKGKIKKTIYIKNKLINIII